jgi:hypothetical protein
LKDKIEIKKKKTTEKEKQYLGCGPLATHALRVLCSASAPRRFKRGT